MRFALAFAASMTAAMFAPAFAPQTKTASSTPDCVSPVNLQSSQARWQEARAAMERRVAVGFQNLPLKDAVGRIFEAAGEPALTYSLEYGDDSQAGEKTVSLPPGSHRVRDALDAVLKPAGLGLRYDREAGAWCVEGRAGLDRCQSVRAYPIADLVFVDGGEVVCDATSLLLQEVLAALPSDTWEGKGGDDSIGGCTSGFALVAVATDEMQERIERRLAEIRQSAEQFRRKARSRMASATNLAQRAASGGNDPDQTSLEAMATATKAVEILRRLEPRK